MSHGTWTPRLFSVMRSQAGRRIGCRFPINLKRQSNAAMEKLLDFKWGEAVVSSDGADIRLRIDDGEEAPRSITISASEAKSLATVLNAFANIIEK